MDRFETRARGLRRDVIRLAKSSRSGHIGSSLSCVDLLVGLFDHFLRLDSKQPEWPERDRFLLSKGHACVPYYACLRDMGLLPAEVLERYGEEGSVLGHHPHRLSSYGIEHGTGSLGHGLGVGVGIAFGAKKLKKDFRSVVLMSDGEQDEGSVWEAVMFAAQHKLDNVLALVDCNRMQALGHNKEILGLEPLAERYESFGWACRRIDGHSSDAIVSALGAFPFEPGRPSVIIADTVKGKGVSFMEDQLLWHYRCPDANEFEAAMAELADA